MNQPVPIRTDLVDAYIFRHTNTIQFLQLLRATEPLHATWQPVMGHIEDGETAIDAVIREVWEETGLRFDGHASPPLYALEQIHPYYLPRRNAIMMSPRFAVEVDSTWTPRLNDEHTDARWIDASDVGTHFMWPGQRAAISEILDGLASETHPLLRVELEMTQLGGVYSSQP